MYCRNCREMVYEDEAVCEYCGKNPKDGTRFCFACGNHTQTGDTICSRCGVEQPLLKTDGKNSLLFFLAVVSGIAVLALVVLFLLI